MLFCTNSKIEKKINENRLEMVKFRQWNIQCFRTLWNRTLFTFSFTTDGATKKPSQFMKPQISIYKKIVLKYKTVFFKTTNRFKLHLILKITM
jgi:hypothetical protein